MQKNKSLPTIKERIDILKEEYDKPIAKSDYTVDDIKGLWYSFSVCSDGLVGYGNFATFVFYNVFTFKEVESFKVNKIKDYLALHPKSTQPCALSFTLRLDEKFIGVFGSAGHFASYLKNSYGAWESEGLKYSFDYQKRELTFDFSNKRFTPNYAWALISTLHKLRVEK